MRTKLIASLTIIFLLFSVESVKAQYCFWIANQSSITLNEIKVRVNGYGNAFGRDLLPSDYLRAGDHCWIETPSSYEIWDVQITRRDGTPILFTYKDRGGTWRRNCYIP
jgi:hypothetical protein